jgi:hypothetical protein
MKKNLRLCHDISFSMASACLSRINYRPGEERELHKMFYEACQAALEYYEAHTEREQRRLSPSKN